MACCVLHNACNYVEDGDVPVAILTDAPGDPMSANHGDDESGTRDKRDVLTCTKATGLYKY